MSTLTIIISGGRGLALSVLTDRRSIPAIPMAGSFRLIDFTLANVAVAELEPVVMLAQTHAASLIEYLGAGGPWTMRAPRALEVPLWLASKERTGQAAYVGSADALYQNRRAIADSGCDTLLLLPGDQVYRLDYRALLRFHHAKGADLTMVTKPVPLEDARSFGRLAFDDDGLIEWFEEKSELPRSTHASLAIYAVNTAVLLRCLDEDARDPGSHRNIGRGIIPRLVGIGRAYAYPFSGYWNEISNLPAWWKANLAFIEDEAAYDLCNFPEGARSVSAGGPPTRVGSGGRVVDSLISGGCAMDGEVIHSVLSPRVRIEEGALVRDSALLDGVVVRTGAVVENCVLDAGVEVGAGARLGGGDEDTPNCDEPDILYSGISVAGEGACIPAGAQIGRNCHIYAGVTPRDFPSLVISAGSSIQKISRG